MAAENWASFAGDDEFSNNLVHDFSEVDSALLMSILDDTPKGVVGEDYDDERLRSVIQSLEAEIHGRTAVDDYDHFFTDNHHQSFDDSDDNFKNQNFWEPSADDLKLMDMDMDMEIEMEIESSFSIPNNEGVVVNSWFVDYPNCENPSTIMDGMVEDGYGYLWQETMPQH